MIWRLAFVLVVYLAENTLQDEICCSKTCSVGDKDASTLDCWQGTENFAIEQIVSAVNNLTGVEIMIQRWKNITGQSINISVEINNTIHRVQELNMLSGGPLDSTSMELVIMIAMQQVLKWTVNQTSATIFDNKYNFDYVCPVPGDYVCTMWMYLFICVTVILALTLFYMAIYVYRIHKQLNKRRLL